jgi:hypothetical protein
LRKSEALYYPNVEPPIAWLMSAALLFDTVMSFVPADSDDTLSEELRSFAEATNAWMPYRPTESTALLVDVPTERLDKAFRAIAMNKPRAAGGDSELEFIIDGGTTCVKDHVFMHGTKLSRPVRDRLQAHGLMLPEDFAQGLTIGDWLVVDTQASDLILSYIADRLAEKKGWTSITDNEGCYVFTTLQQTEKAEDAEDHLARLLVTELVPDIIEAVPLDTYCRLRELYKPIREHLALFINDAVLENRLTHIGDPEELRHAVDEYIKDLRNEVLEFRESTFGAMFRKWGPFSLGSIVSLGAAIPGPWAFPLAGAGLLLMAVDKAGVLERKATLRGNMVRLLAAARNDVIEASAVKRFLIA